MNITHEFIAAARRIAFLFRKEALAIVKDSANRVILIAPVLLQSLIFGYGATYDLNHAPYALFNESHGADSRELIARLDASGVFVRKANLSNARDMASAIESGQAIVVLHMASDFDARLASRGSAPLQLILDGRNSTTANMVAGHLSTLLAQFNASQGAASTLTSNPRVNIQVRSWFNPNQESRWNLIPALIAALSMIQTLLISALSVAREREQGTFDQLLVTPLRPMEILIGKALPSIMIGLIQASLIFGVSLWWFRIPLSGSAILIYAGLALFSTACVGIGLSISALSLNMQQAMVYAFVLIMPLMLLSGLVTPVSNMPDVLQALTYADPLRFAIDLVRRVYLEGALLHDVQTDLWPMAAVALATLPVAAWLFRNRLT